MSQVLSESKVLSKSKVLSETAPRTAANPPPQATPEFRGRIYNSITETIGATPIVRLNRLPKEHGVKANILAKLEFFNPIASVKDRIGVSMIDALEAAGRLGPGAVLVEPTSGNTGIALAFVAAARGYRLILVMPNSMSIERRKMLALLGAELELTPARAGHERRHRARRGDCAQHAERHRAAAVSQSRQSGNPSPHHGRGNLARYRRRHRCLRRRGRHRRHHHGRRPGPEAAQTVRCTSIAVEPEDSPVLSGGKPGPHKIQGIGAGFVPEILDRSVIDEVVTVSNQSAFETARSARPPRRHPGRHFVGRRGRRSPENRRAPGIQRQEYRRDHSVLRRALSVDGAFRRAVTGGERLCYRLAGCAAREP